MIIIYDPTNNKTIKTSLINTAGKPKCAYKDSSRCKLVKINLSKKLKGNFEADFELPTSFPDSAKTIK